ncbi:MAG: hypothetical protein M3N93_15060 [Acidobacteriota bacterium]|nr:hypothetical protein [Acidobacteriota bacterium]
MSSRGSVAAAVLAVALVFAQVLHAAVNPDAAIMQDFEKRVDAYLQLRKVVEAQMKVKLKSTASQEKINHYENELGRKVREARIGARQGDIFTPDISAEMRRLTTLAMQPGDGVQIRQSLRHAEPVQLHLKVNDRYPQRVPLQSTPPSLLGNLPRLPPEIEYRVTGTDLVLLDTRANLIVDLIPGMFA